MIARISITIGLLFYAYIIFAQISEPVDSYKIFEKAKQLSEESKFEEVIAEYDKVDRNDSNYVASLLEKSLIYIKLKNYEKASQICLEGMKFNFNYQYKFLINRAVTLKLLKKNEEALQVVEEGLKVYKNNSLLIYNKGSIYFGMGKYKEALELYKQSLLLNPFYANCHLNLGLMALNEGNIAQAMMSLNMFLILEPNSDRSLGVLQKLDNAISSKFERESKSISLSAEGDDFSELDLIISNYAALAKNFKTPIKLDLAIAKQNYLLLSKLENQSNDKGFWMQTYVPFFKALYDQNKYSDFTYHILQSSGTEYHQTLVKKNLAGVTKFKDWASININTLGSSVNTIVDGKAVKAKYSYNSATGSVESVGVINAKGQEIGYYEYFFTNGGLYAKGNYNDKGEKEGLWKLYYSNGAPHEELYYKLGVRDGKYKVFHEDGTLKKEGLMVNDKQDGVEKEYNAARVFVEQSNFKNGIHEGESFLNFDFSEKYKKFKGQYVNGEVNDTLYEYYDNGLLKNLKMMVNGKAKGAEKSYYRNGKIYSEISNENNVQNGPYKTYHRDGKLKEEGAFAAGTSVGSYKEYYDNGALADEYIYDENGKVQGTRKFYDTDGKIFNVLEYQKDEIVAYTYFNKEGKIIKEDKRKKGEFKFTGYYPEGNIKLEGIYTNKGKQGLWKYYDEFGNLKSEEIYNSQGKLDGKVKNYYSDNQLKSDAEYKNGVEHGSYVSYHENGKKKSEGYMVDGLAQGYWNYYSGDGTIDSKKYFSGGKTHGYQQHFSCTGILEKEEFYKGELISKIINYDSLGMPDQETAFANGTGTYKSFYSNKIEKERVQFIYGLSHGEVLRHHFNGKISLTGTYHNNEETGTWKWYNKAGILITEGVYDNGQKNGKWTYYHPNGKLKQSNFYQRGEAQGDGSWYHENGQLEVKKYFVDDQEEGEANYYDDAGELQIRKYFHNGIIVGYTYYEKNGQLKAPINTANGTYKAVTYYKNGNKAREYEVSKGEVNNTYLEYHSNGNLVEKINHKNGLYDGQRIIFYANNILKSEENYAIGELHGRCKYYYPNGKIEKELNYRCGILHGPAIYYSNTGAVVLTQTNYSGTVIKEK